MSYEYSKERAKIFTEDGSRIMLQIRDNIQKHIKNAGAVMMTNAWQGVLGDTWTMLACVDYIVELGEIVEVTPKNTMGQYRVFTSKMQG